MRQSKNPVRVPRAVYEGLEAIRKSGETNMLDRPMVMRLAYEREFYELVTWLDENKKLYSEGIFRGFAVEENSSN